MDLLLSKTSLLDTCLQIGLGTFYEIRDVDMGIGSVVDEEQFDDATHGLKQLHDLDYTLISCMAMHGPTKSFAKKKTYPYIILPPISLHPSSFISTPLPSLPIFSYPPNLFHHPSFILPLSTTCVYTYSIFTTFMQYPWIIFSYHPFHWWYSYHVPYMPVALHARLSPLIPFIPIF